MTSYFVYILKCNDNSYYTGITNNLDRRLKEHQSGYGNVSYTKTRLPVTLVFSQQFHRADQAIALEKQIKGWSRKKKEAFINEEWEKLKLLSRNYTQFGNQAK
ncbi:GIY-YIG nuclease family protein [Ferruginibacter sp. HRS2-29]|uniref:GIY-YIG nuclease family protein n=1 Tax=Ferruginibacter sp. HRS2-29 TaxID=2487334 RepID=UPI0020CD3521|nr:GIY-YIG nuclease family protein [Ferruginibacter sp. HRS2-29]MCP9751452.1 GIY-YIG nuclease family protein [Ferruginibacter sp. HRS2-29]